METMRNINWMGLLGGLAAAVICAIGGTAMLFLILTPQPSLGAKEQIERIMLIREQAPPVTVEFLLPPPMITKDGKVLCLKPPTTAIKEPTVAKPKQDPKDEGWHKEK